MGRVQRIGMLTAGGDCPGLNAVIRAVVKAARRQNPPIEIIGILDGYSGLVEDRTRPLDDGDVSGILARGGTILGTSNRDNPFNFLSDGESKPRDRSKDAVETFQRHQLDGLIAIGGDGTLSCALRLSKLGIPIMGVPKTIDNDLEGTDATFGFDSALGVATDAIDRLHTTAESHHRVLICEVMGRHTGWIALRAGTAGGGDVILIPEIPFDIEKICEAVRSRQRKGKNFSIVVVAEGSTFKGRGLVTHGSYKGVDRRPRLGGIGQEIAVQIERRLDDEARVVVLGHLQRGGIPSAYDRWLATHFGVHAIELVVKKRWGQMVAVHSREFKSFPIKKAVHHLRRIDPKGQEVRAARAVGTSFGD